MIRKKKGEIEWLEFDILQDIPSLKHGVFLRRGGVSEGAFDSLNVLMKGDSDENILENRRRIEEALGIGTLNSAHQVHGTDITYVKKNDPTPTCDGLITQEKGVPLLIGHADCQATFFYDPIHKAIGNVHAGWKGQALDIYKNMIETMKRRFSSDPANLLVCISPSLGPENSEFKNYQKELPTSFLAFEFKPTYFNLWEVARYQLEKEGILPHHIEIAKMNTYLNPQDFFSYRREKAQGRTDHITGCHGSVCAIQ